MRFALVAMMMVACVPMGTTAWGTPAAAGAPATAGEAAPGEAPTPGATATGAFDLVYAVPPGWSEQRGADAITLTMAIPDDYSPVSYALVILPSQPLRGTLTETFQALWAEMITPNFTPTFAQGIEPAPIRRRLASGYVAAFDGEVMNANRGGMVTTVLYLIASGDRVVPVLGMYGNYDARKGEPMLAGFFDTLTIAGAAAPTAPLFDAGELVGAWSTQSAEYANYVDTSGNYRGDATIAVRQDHTFNADGSYSAYASAYQSGRGFDRGTSSGTWRVDDDTIVIESGGASIRIRVLAVGTHRGARSIYLPPSYAATTAPEFGRPRTVGDWFGPM